MYGKERIYKKVEIIGVSSQGIEAAIETALRKAQKSLDKISWFEVQDIRGHVGENGKVAEYQVVIKVSFELNVYAARFAAPGLDIASLRFKF